MADDPKICPFMSKPVIDITGAGIPLPQIFEAPCIEDRCRAWKPAINNPISGGLPRKISGYHVAPGYCMLIPASEPELKFIPNISQEE